MATYFDAYGNPVKPKSAGMVLPLVLGLVALGAGDYWLWKERARAMGDANTATARLAATEAVEKDLAQKVEKLEAERTELIEAKEQAVKDAQARALELAKLKDDVAGVEVVNQPDAKAADKDKKADTKPGAKDDAADKKADDKKADEKIETRPKTKSKPKKKPAEHAHKSKKDTGAPAPSGEL